MYIYIYIWECEVRARQSIQRALLQLLDYFLNLDACFLPAVPFQFPYFPCGQCFLHRFFHWFYSIFSFIQFSQLLAFVIAQVPFALLGDRARGIFETVYLDDDLRTWVRTKVLMLWIVDGRHFDASF